MKSTQCDRTGLLNKSGCATSDTLPSCSSTLLNKKSKLSYSSVLPLSLTKTHGTPTNLGIPLLMHFNFNF